MPKTNPREEQVLNFIREFSAENGYAPSIREICAGVGLRSTASVNYHLKNLQQKGMLTLGEKGRKRAIAAPQRPGQIRLIATVTAGPPILALANREGTISWDGDPTCFALRVRGDSMINAGIFSGDVVVVRPQPTADDGQIVVARLEDEATVKRLRRRNGQIWLMPENEAYAPIDGTYAQIVGVVKALVREHLANSRTNKFLRLFFPVGTFLPHSRDQHFTFFP